MNAFIFLHTSHPTIFFFHSLKQTKTKKTRKHSILTVNHKNAGKIRMNFIRLGKTQKHVIRESTTNIQIMPLRAWAHLNTQT